MPRLRMPALRLAAGALILHASPTPAAVFNVGPAGTYASLPLAIAAATTTPGSAHEIRLQATTFTDAPSINYSSNKALVISGGWNAAFSSQSDNPEDTAFTIPPAANSRPLRIQVNSGLIALSNFTAHGGFRDSDGGGLALNTATSGRLVVQDCVVRDNAGGSAFANKGGGIDAYATGASHLRISRCDVHDNLLQVGSSATGGGIYLTSIDTATVVLEDSRIVGNVLEDRLDSESATIDLSEAGLAVFAYGDSIINVLRNHIVDNHVAANNPAVVASQNYGATFSAGGFPAEGTGVVIARGNVIRANGTNATLGGRAHAGATASGNGRVDLGDSEISQGAGGQLGLQLQSNAATSRLDVTNMTVADNSGMGVRANPVFPAAIAGSFFNNIVDGNSAASQPLADWLDSSNNLIDAAPGFVARDGGNYTLLPDSPAIDAGEASPPGGLGSFDAGGGMRIVGFAVDIGAHEFGSLTVFIDGFE